MASNPSQWALRFVRLRWLNLGLALIATVSCGYLATQLTFNFSPDNIFVATDPAHLFYKNHFVPEFGQTANVCLIAIDGNLNKLEVQETLIELHSDIEKVEGVESVRSLVNTKIARKIDGLTQAVNVFENGKTSEDVLAYVSSDPAMKNLLISEKGNIPTIAVGLPLHLGDMSSGDEITIRLKAAIARVAAKHPDLKFYLAGNPVLQYETISTLKSDQLLFLPLTVIFMALLLWLSFHNWLGVVLPFMATAASALWAMGWLVLRGHPLDIINNKLAVLLLVVGISAAVQMFARFQDELALARREMPDPHNPLARDHIVARCVEVLVVPCFLTTLIAALGFGAVAVSSVTIIRNFGIDAAVGIMGSYVSTMLIVPALLRILPFPKERSPSVNSQKMTVIDRILQRMSRFSMTYPKQIVAAAVILACVSVYFAKDIRANQKFTSELPNNAPGIEALKFLEENVTGILPFEIVFEATPERLQQPDVVRAGARLEDFMAKYPLVTVTRSFAGILLSIDRSLTGVTAKSATTFSDEKITQLTQLFEMGDEETVKAGSQDFYSKDGKYYRVQGLLKDVTTTELGEFRDLVEAQVKLIPLEGVKIYLTGSTIVSANALDQVIFSTISAIGAAILAIFLLILLLLKSFKFALMALFPNLLPVIVTLATMNIFGVSLRVATVLIFSMALGIAVDACVYLITRFRQEANVHQTTQGQSYKDALHAAVERTMRGSGRPVVYTTLMLLAGFSTLSISKFVALRDFAILSSVTLATALVVDLLLWPALVILMKPKLNSNSLT